MFAEGLAEWAHALASGFSACGAEGSNSRQAICAGAEKNSGSISVSGGTFESDTVGTFNPLRSFGKVKWTCVSGRKP